MITWKTYEHGRAGELSMLNRDRNNLAKHPLDRHRADIAHGTIIKQMRDKKLMRLRERLIKASQASDLREMDKIQKMMRDHTKESKETGNYDT